ncbi:MAG: DUF6252 family protein [Cyclobacteriaceae bacterium]
MKTYLLSIFLFSLSLCVSCDFGLTQDDDDLTELEKLPPLTTTGENTFGCLVNGKAFVVKNTSNITAFYQQKLLFVSAGIDRNGIDEGVSFTVYETESETNTFNLSDTLNISCSYSDFSNYPDSYCQYEKENIINGEFNINSFDAENYIISGTFEFNAALYKCDTIRVTDGRFDLQYIP